MENVLVIAIIVLTIAVAFNYLLTFALIRKHNSGQEVYKPVFLEPGTRAPDFQAETLDGKAVTQNDYVGRKIAYLFSGSGCPTCIEMMPIFNNLQPKARWSGVELLFVSIDDVEQTREFLNQHPTTIPVVVAPRRSNPFYENYKANGTPSFCLVNEQGLVESAGFADMHAENWQALKNAWNSAAERMPALAVGGGR